MDKNSQNFSIQKAMQLAQSDAGRKLYSYLQQKDSAALEQAMQLAAKGDYSAMQQTLSTLLKSEKAQALLKQLED